jgi:ABC-2 type transport system permease protein
MRRVLFLAWAEVLHVIRDRATLAQIFVVPVVQLLVLSNAATFAIQNTAAFVVDQDRSQVSRGLATRLEASGHFRLLDRDASPANAERALDDGRASLVVVMPRGLEADLARSGRGEVQLVLNGERGSAAGVVRSHAAEIIARYSRELAEAGRPAQAGGLSVPVDIRTRHQFNPALNYKHYMVPGILVSLVTLIGTLLTAQNIAREKELGTLEQLNVTPITRPQFIAAKLLPFWALAMLILAIGLIAGRLAFDIPMRGSLFLLFGAAAVYLVVALALGLFISTIVETQQQAMFVTFFVMMIYLLMSGLFTPIDSMPRWVQIVADLTPIKHFVVIARGILLKGSGIAELTRELVILPIYAAVMIGVAVAMHRKRTA